MTVKEVSELTRLTPNHLSQLRFRGIGPRYLKPSPRVVLYEESEILEWLENSVVETKNPLAK